MILRAEAIPTENKYIVKMPEQSIKAILSKRSYQKWISWDLIYEWEEDFASHYKVPILSDSYVPKIYERLISNRITKNVFREWPNRTLQYLDSFGRRASPKYITFDLNPAPSFYPQMSTRRNTIPLIIDFWKHEDLGSFYQAYKNCDAILVSSLEVCNHFKVHKMPINYLHLPLSLSDRHKQMELKEKIYDILIPARSNQILWNYLLEFTSKYPDVEYVYRSETISPGQMPYVSNKRGSLGNFSNRNEYLKLISQSKIAFYSTPGMDEGAQRTGGFNPVTPRYLELLNARCLMLGRYPLNEETTFYEVDKVCPHVEAYEDFEKTLLLHLNTTNPNWDDHIDILNKHWTSKRLELLDKLLKL